MIYRESTLEFNVNSYSQPLIKTNIKISTQDVGTAKLIFILTKDGLPLPLANVKGVLTMIFADGSRSDREITITDKVNGVAEYILSDNEIKHYGNVHSVLNLHYVNKQSLSVHEFTFEIIQNLVDKDIAPSAEYYISDFESLKSTLNKLYDDITEKFKDLNNVETIQGSQEKADAALSSAKEYTDKHKNNFQNPHQVTKEQIGLSDVINVKQASEIDFKEHKNNFSNPHKVTKDHIGLSEVDNVKQASYTDFQNHQKDSLIHLQTGERTKWNGAQLFKLTDDSGKPFYKDAREVTDYNTLISTGTYYIDNAGENSPLSTSKFLLSVLSYGNAVKQLATDVTNGDKMYFRARKTDGNWTGWVDISHFSYTPDWKTPTLLNGWAQYQTTDNDLQIRFSKDPLGYVTVRGAIEGGMLGSNVPAFNLPEGFRPPSPVYYAGITSSSGAGGTPQIFRSVFLPNGDVCVQSSSNTTNPNAFIAFHKTFLTK